MAATKCDCICVPRDEYERLKAQKGTQKTARKPKTVSAKAKTSKTRQKARQTQRMAEPKVMAIAEPKETAKKTDKKTTKKTTAKTKSKAVTKTKSKPKMNTVYEVDYPKSIPAPKRDAPYNGKVIERRTKAPRQVSAPRETVVVRETVKIEAPKEPKVEGERVEEEGRGHGSRRRYRQQGHRKETERGTQGAQGGKAGQTRAEAVGKVQHRV